MKLATYQDGSRAGQLVVVSRDLSLAHFATGIATRMQSLLDDWNFLSPQLEDLYATLNTGKARHAFAFDPRLALAPLPRVAEHLVAACCTDADGADAPRLRQAGGALRGAHTPLVLADASVAADLGAGLAVATAELAQGCSAERALDAVRRLLLANHARLPEADDDGAAQPAAAFAPVAVTPDELGAGWAGGRAGLTLKVDVDGRPLGRIDTAAAQRWGFGALIARAAVARPLAAGSLVASGALDGADPAQGFASRAAQRAQEAATDGQPRARWLAAGAQLVIEAFAGDGTSVFGAIVQRVRAAGDDAGADAVAGA